MKKSLNFSLIYILFGSCGTEIIGKSCIQAKGMLVENHEIFSCFNLKTEK